MAWKFVIYLCGMSIHSWSNVWVCRHFSSCLSFFTHIYINTTEIHHCRNFALYAVLLGDHRFSCVELKARNFRAPWIAFAVRWVDRQQTAVACTAESEGSYIISFLTFSHIIAGSCWIKLRRLKPHRCFRLSCDWRVFWDSSAVPLLYPGPSVNVPPWGDGGGYG